MHTRSTISLDQTPRRLGPYEVLSVLGSGGFGEVLLARDPRLDRKVAIKVPHAHLLSSKEDRERFLWESQSLAKLKHNGIVTVHEVVTDEALSYLVTEYLQGSTLAEYIKTQTLTYGSIIQIVSAIAEALDHAHHHGIVHRDVKPSNIVMIVNKIRPVLVDFGVAFSLHKTPSGKRQFAGTPSYMSPEQTYGEMKAIDGRSDQYSLGVIFYKMLTAQHPFKIDERVENLVRRIRKEEPTRPSAICHSTPRQLDAICLRALAKAPEDRFESCLEFADELNGAAHQLSPMLKRIPGEKALPLRKGKPSRQRRRVTLLALRSRLIHPAQLKELGEEREFEFQQTFRATCRKLAGQRHGTLLESTGADWLICFGYPHSNERVAEQAVHVGLELLAACPELAPGGSRVELTLIVHAGEVIIGDRSEQEREFDITGRPRTHVMNVLGSTDPGSLYVTDPLHATITRQYESQPIHTGNETPLHRVGAARRAIELRDAESVLVGRDQELGLMLERWELVEESISTGQVILLSGEAGIGKSRMVQILKEHVVASNAQAQILEWRCQPNRYESPFFPIRNALEHAIVWNDLIEPEKKWERIVAYANEIGLLPQDVPAILALLGQSELAAKAPGIPDDLWIEEAKKHCEAHANLTPNRYRDLVKSGLHSWLATLCKLKPMLLVVEDLHWIDPSTLEFLQRLVEKEQSLPIFILLTYRPEFRIPWELRSSHTQIALNRLTKRQVRQFLKIALKREEVPDWLLKEMVKKTEGNPLYLEEYTRLVREGDFLLEDSTQSKLPGRIPENLQDLVLANLDRSTTHFSLVQQAAAIGREFSADLLRPVCKLQSIQLVEELYRLVESGLLVDRGRKSGGTFAFRHSLIQDAAYGTLLNQDRKEVHRRIAATLESDFPECKPEVLALHYGEAGNHAKAVRYWTDAGTQAVRSFAHLEAIGHLRRGLQLLRDEHPDDGQERGPSPSENAVDWPSREEMELDLLVPLGASLLSVHGYSAAEPGALYDRALELASKLNQPEKLIACTWAKGSWHVGRNEFSICLRMAERVWEQAEASGNPYFRSGIRMLPSLAHFYGANYHESKQHCEDGLAMLSEVQIEENQSKPYHIGMDPEVLHLGYLARNQWMLGFPDTAREQLNQALALAEKRKAPFEQAFLHHIATSLHKLAGDTARALEHIERSIKIAEEEGYDFWRVLGYLYRFALWHDQNETSDHAAAYAATLHSYERNGARLALSKYYGYLAEMHRTRGRIDKALSVLNESYAHLRGGGGTFYLPDLLRLQGDLLLEQDPEHQEEAIRCYEESLEEARNTGSNFWMLRTAVRMAERHLNAGETEKVRELLQPIHAGFEQGQNLPIYQKAEALLAKLDP